MNLMIFEIFNLFFFFFFLTESRNLQYLDQGLLWKVEMEPLKRRSSVTVNTPAAWNCMSSSHSSLEIDIYQKLVMFVVYLWAVWVTSSFEVRGDMLVWLNWLLVHIFPFICR